MRARRVTLGVISNIYDKGAIAFVQLALVPVLAVHWGLEAYGAWVLLATIPSFLSVSDFGFATAAGTKMVMLAAKDRREDAVKVFQSAWMMILLSTTAVLIVALAIVYMIPGNWLPSGGVMTDGEARATLLILIIYGIVSLQGSIFMAGFRTGGLFHLSVFWAANTILFENLMAIAAAFAGGKPSTVAAALLVSRGAALVVQNILLRRKVPWLLIGLSQATRREVKVLLSPALAVVMMPLSQAAFLQGTAIALGLAVSESAVPAFTAARTISRIGLQFTQLVTHAIMPEYSSAVARNDRLSQSIMMLTVVGTSMLVSVPFAIILSTMGPTFIGLWTHGVIHVTPAICIAFAISVVFGGIWTPISNLLLAMNRHATFSYIYVVMALATMPIAYGLSHFFGAAGAAMSIALLDFVMFIVVMRVAAGLLPKLPELRDAGSHLWLKVRASPILRRLRSQT